MQGQRRFECKVRKGFNAGSENSLIQCQGWHRLKVKGRHELKVREGRGRI